MSIKNVILPTQWTNSNNEQEEEGNKLSVKEQLAILTRERDLKEQRIESRFSIMTSSKQIEEIGLSFFDNLSHVMSNEQAFQYYLTELESLRKTHNNEGDNINEDFVNDIRVLLEKKKLEVYAMRRQCFGSGVTT